MSRVTFCRSICLVMMLALASDEVLFGQVSQEDTRSSQAVRELLVEQKELMESLRELDDQQARIETELATVATLLELQRQIEELERQLERIGDDRSDDGETEQKLAKLELEIESLHWQRELGHFESRVTELLDWLEEVSPNYSDAIAKRLSQLKSKIGRTRQGLRTGRIKVTENEEPAADWDQEYALVDLTEELLAAIEEDEDVVGELYEELAELLYAEQDGKKSSAARTEKKPTDPTLLPIQVDSQSLSEVTDTSFESTVVPLLKTYCFDCHGNDSSYGELNLQSLVAQRPLVVERQKWINVIEQMKNRVMPPEDGSQPTEEQRRILVLATHNEIHNYDYSQISNPGFESTRRLTHAEYDNTISDLFGVNIEIAARFPNELSGKTGFDNTGNTLFLQPSLMERYITAADEVVERLLPKTIETAQQRIAFDRVFSRSEGSGNDLEAARTIITSFVGRAWRRPLRDEEKASLLQEYEAHREQGLGHQDAIRSIVKQTLVSPKFLFKFEDVTSQDHAFRVSGWELASRLSYFLWASQPDETLYRLAQGDDLFQPEVLRAQVDRMLNDPRAKSLGELFAAQWLGSQYIGTRVRLDPIDNPWCTETLMEAMRQETALFFHSLVVDNAEISQLINADYTFLNGELAKLYRIRGVRGTEMRRVQLEGSQRGGLLGQASVLAVTSFPYRTSPVVRGKWILETLLGTPPPPPPPNVGDLSEELASNERLTIREKLERHRSAPSCAACHSEMDPLGLSLEKYDWFGRYRERYERDRIDDQGELPDGTSFAGLAGLKEAILERKNKELLRQITQKMLAYALGRQLEYFDEPAIRKIVEDIGRNESRFRPLIYGIVSSYPFQYKQLSSTVTRTTTGGQHDVP